MRFKPTYTGPGPAQESTKQVAIRVALYAPIAYLGYFVSLYLPDGLAQVPPGLIMVAFGLMCFMWALELFNRAILWKNTRGY